MKFKIFVNCFTNNEEEIPVSKSLENNEEIVTTVYHIKMYLTIFLNENYDNLKVTIIRNKKRINITNDDVEIENDDKICVQKLDNKPFKGITMKTGHTLKEMEIEKIKNIINRIIQVPDEQEDAYYDLLDMFDLMEPEKKSLKRLHLTL